MTVVGLIFSYYLLEIFLSFDYEARISLVFFLKQLFYDTFVAKNVDKRDLRLFNELVLVNWLQNNFERFNRCSKFSAAQISPNKRFNKKIGLHIQY